MSKLKYIGLIFVMMGISLLWLYSRPTICKFPANNKITIAPVQRTNFVEFIPVTGETTGDSIEHVRIQVDQMYLSRISIGLKGTMSVDDSIYILEVTHIFSEITYGRITAEMKFRDQKPVMTEDKRMRIRLELGKPADALVIPVGGFYYDTGGSWIYVVRNDVATKRKIKLGRKNTEYFEVLDGLEVGEHVITSSYERFNDRDSILVSSLTK